MNFKKLAQDLFILAFVLGMFFGWAYTIGALLMQPTKTDTRDSYRGRLLEFAWYGTFVIIGALMLFCVVAPDAFNTIFNGNNPHNNGKEMTPFIWFGAMGLWQCIFPATVGLGWTKSAQEASSGAFWGAIASLVSGILVILYVTAVH